LFKSGMEFIDVGTVDGFQGREKDIIVFSSVRASNKSKEDGEKSNGIGFVSHRQRLNVALTRAKYSMYIVGNVRALSSNQDWLECIQHSKENKSIIDIEHENTNSNEFNRFLLKKPLK
jgi:superfamily I DNA and/or RNA helicase